MPRFRDVVVVVAIAGAIAASQLPAGASARSVRDPHGSIPPNTRLTDVAFLDPDHGYGVFTVEGPTRCNDRVGETRNGGATFSRPVPITAWNCGSTAPVSSLAFDDHGDGFLYGPKLYVTHDGGVNWMNLPEPGVVLSIEALGYSIWMLEAVTHASSGTAATVLLFESSNGGWTWSRSPVPRVPLSEGAAQATAWLVRVTQSVAYLGTQPLFRNGGGVGTAPMWLTTDDGASWVPRSITCSRWTMTVAMSAAPDGTLLAVCAGEPGAGMQGKETLRSVNDGVSWQVRSTCNLGTRCPVGVPISGYLSEIDAVSARTAYLVGGRSALTVTRDGGIRWAAVPGIGSTAGGTSQVIFFDTRHGIVLGDGDQANERPVLWQTTDGRHWRLVVPRYATPLR